jgi:hypothetical protein
MKTFKLVLNGFLFAACILLIGCAASNKMIPNQPLIMSLDSYKNFSVMVESDGTEHVEKELSDLRCLVLSRIIELNLFDKIILKDDMVPEEKTLLVHVKITKIRKVSGRTRFFLGSFAGKASVTSELLFVDANSNKTIGIYTVIGRSGNHDFSGGTHDAVKKTTEAITDIISNNYKSIGP